MPGKPVNEAVHVSMVTMIGNVILSAAKLFAGIFAHSSAMISDAVHSASDVLSTIVVLVGVKMAGRASDEGHPYGHERMECVASLLLAILLMGTGLGIGWSGVNKILSGMQGDLQAPGALALVAALVSIGVKEWMYWYTRAPAKRLKSGALMADAWHHRSDALSSIGSFAGILGARMGFPLLDPIASLVICLFILKVAFDIGKESISQLVDASAGHELEDGMRAFVLRQDGVLGLDSLRSRKFGSRIYVDASIRADGAQSLEQAHDIAEHVHHALESEYPDVKHCMIHVNPVQKSA